MKNANDAGSAPRRWDSSPINQRFAIAAIQWSDKGRGARVAGGRALETGHAKTRRHGEGPETREGALKSLAAHEIPLVYRGGGKVVCILKIFSTQPVARSSFIPWLAEYFNLSGHGHSKCAMFPFRIHADGSG